LAIKNRHIGRDRNLEKAMKDANETVKMTQSLNICYAIA
jgi:hypothetical protein